MAAEQQRWLSAAINLFGRNWITLTGAVLACASGFFIAGFLLLTIVQYNESPYLGIMALLILPAVFMGGFLMIPVGAYWDHWRSHRRGNAPQPPLETGPFPVINLNSPHTRRVACIAIVLTGVNLLIISAVTYHGVIFMDSVTFCGRVCHTVMEPEHTAYLDSPHSRVKCVECHIGPGAPWFVRAKLSGMGQLFAVAFNTYEKPVPTPVHNLRPSQDTCEQCHWPEKFTGDRIRLITKFLEDEENTPVQSVLLMHIGGGASEHHGIHTWHIDPKIKTTYIAADDQRQDIVYVRVEKEDGTVEEFKARDIDTFEGETRVMDCIDCHNRPSHIFQLPDEAVDAALAARRIDRGIPYIKRIAVEALQAAEGQDGDLERIENHIRAYYEANHAEFLAENEEKVETAIETALAIYRRNVFPKMDVTWGTYTDNIGHTQWPGCFRCHNDNLVTDSGKTIGDDCTICHAILAWDETDPRILEELQIR